MILGGSRGGRGAQGAQIGPWRTEDALPDAQNLGRSAAVWRRGGAAFSLTKTAHPISLEIQN